MEPMVFGLKAQSYTEALNQMQEWLNKQTGVNKGIRVEVKDNKTTVTLDDGRVGVARCNPCDKFDVVTGIRVALDDIERKYTKLNDVEKNLLNTALLIGATMVEVDEDYINFHKPMTRDVMTCDRTNDMFKFLENDTIYSIAEILRNRG